MIEPFPDSARRVALRVSAGCGYPAEPPFDPSADYPEYGSKEFLSGEYNAVYDLVRMAMVDLGLDRAHYGTAAWSPLSGLIQPGNRVVIKPNLVLEGAQQDAITTHASVVRPLVDYAWAAMERRGEIVVCDAPVAQANFDEITRRNGLAEMVRQLQARGTVVSLHDLRALRVVSRNGVWVGEEEEAHGRVKSVVVNLGQRSAFADPHFDTRRLHGGSYGRRFTAEHQTLERHEYCVSGAVLGADVVISVPKLKTHSKAGLTCCLKNLVGINVDKNYLAHFRVGPANEGGDEFPHLPAWRLPLTRAVRCLHDIVLADHWRITGRLVAAASGALHSVLHHKPNRATSQLEDANGTADWFFESLTGTPCRQGAWQGNETIWRMILDLNQIFLYARSDGTMSDRVQRRVFYVVDGVVAGEGAGPLRPTPVPLGLIACGDNGLMVDLALLDFLEIAPECLPVYREATSGRFQWIGPADGPAVLLSGQPWQRSAGPASQAIQPPPMWDFRHRMK